MAKNTSDLAKIGKETFDMIDNNIFSQYGRKSKHPAASAPPRQPAVCCYHRYQPQQAYVVQQQVYAAPVTVLTERVINCEEAAKIYGGTLYVDDHRIRKPAPVTVNERVINCEEAAKIYGGTLYVDDHPIRKPARKGFFF